MWKFTFCWPIRAQPHCVTKRAPVNIFPFATAFFIICAVWSGNSTDYAHTHSLQRNSEISPRRLFRPFRLVARKHGPKIGVAHLVIFCYLLSITPFCNVSSSHLTSVLPTGRYAVEKIRLFSYFSIWVHSLKSENPAHFSHPILASQYTHSHYHTAPHLRNYSSRFSQLIRAN